MANERANRKTSGRGKKVNAIGKGGGQTVETLESGQIQIDFEAKPQKGKDSSKVGATLLPLPKYEDIGPISQAYGSRLTADWDASGTLKIWPALRSGDEMPADYRFYDHEYLMKTYGLKGWQFGNWTSQEDRYNYVSALGISLFDLKRILYFPNEGIGLQGKLGISIGARGQGPALAHFEPGRWIINLTRYSDHGNTRGNYRKPSARINPKIEFFLRSGGVGSFAHEYGHALDYFFGGYYDQDPKNFSLSGGDSTRFRVSQELKKRKTMRGAMERLLAAIMWEEENKTYTKYATIIRAYAAETSDYWIQRNEIFARAFEQWVHTKIGKNQKVKENYFLTAEKYQSLVYMDEALMKKVEPLMDMLIAMMRRSLVPAKRRTYTKA